MKKPKIEHLPARSDELMRYLETMTPVEVRVGGRVFVTTLSKLNVGEREGKAK